MRMVKLLVAGDPAQHTGGYIYDARIAGALNSLGYVVETVGLEGRFPDADEKAAQALDKALADCSAGQLVIVDGLVLGGLPNIIAHHAERLCLIALIHHPLADESGLDAALANCLFVSERKALEQVGQVVVTSHFTAGRLMQCYSVPSARLAVIEPGLDKPALPGKQTGGPPRLLCVATLIPRKGHQVLVDALSRLTDLDWHCDCIGDTGRDPDCTRQVRAAIQSKGLSGRITLAGGYSPQQLANAYRQATLFVLPSFYEGYGMVITEALAYGLPVVTTTGGALPQTLPRDAGLTVPPGDGEALAGALRRVLASPGLAHQLATGARAAARDLPGWEEAGARFAAVIEQVIRNATCS